MIMITNRNAETASQYEVRSFLFEEMEVKIYGKLQKCMPLVQ